MSYKEDLVLEIIKSITWNIFFRHTTLKLLLIFTSECLFGSIVVQDEVTPYEFFVHDKEVKGPLHEVLSAVKDHTSEKVLEILYLPQAKFRVQAVTRCSSSIPGNIRGGGGVIQRGLALGFPIPHNFEKLR